MGRSLTDARRTSRSVFGLVGGWGVLSCGVAATGGAARLSAGNLPTTGPKDGRGKMVGALSLA
ncbi:MAG: hypothetical protein WA948_07165, partial [Pontixanthobacter sp.]